MRLRSADEHEGEGHHERDDAEPFGEGCEQDGQATDLLSGVGIAPENLAKIFDLYFTTKQTGTGIGLSLVYRTIQLHNGDIDVESTLGEGTTFIIKLPQARPGAAAPTKSSNLTDLRKVENL